jgi:hypothetical protein
MPAQLKHRNPYQKDTKLVLFAIEREKFRSPPPLQPPTRLKIAWCVPQQSWGALYLALYSGHTCGNQCGIQFQQLPDLTSTIKSDKYRLSHQRGLCPCTCAWTQSSRLSATEASALHGTDHPCIFGHACLPAAIRWKVHSKHAPILILR